MFIKKSTYKALIDRIESIENKLGIVWKATGEYPYHLDLDDKWSIQGRLQEISDKVVKLVPKK